MSLKNNLIQLMKEKNITIKELAHHTGISEPTLKRLRTSDNANPTLDVLIKLSTVLNVSLPQLIEKKTEKLVIYQDKFSLPNDTVTEFVYVFTKDTFNFLKGTKAIFRRQTPGSPITQFIITNQGQLLEKIDEEKWLFRNEKYENFSINRNAVLAYIIKELFEVNYV